MQRHYQNMSRFSFIHSWNDLPKVKDKISVINNDEYVSIEPCWLSYFVKNDDALYFDSLSVIFIPKVIEKFHWQQKYQIKDFQEKAYDLLILNFVSDL